VDGIHDLGGKQGFGRIDRTESPSAFSDRWEAAVFAIVNALMRGGIIHNTDEFRHAVERIDPISYLSDGYYGRWLGAVETLLIEHGVLTRAQITALARRAGAPADARIAARPEARAPQFDYPPSETGAQRSVSHGPAFEAGAQVRCRTVPSTGHTRLPAYARGKTGRVMAVHGAWVLPDTNAHGQGEAAEYLYTVQFSGTELWGAESEPDTVVCLDLFESYLSSPAKQTT
jgi:nitrile hydratase